MIQTSQVFTRLLIFNYLLLSFFPSMEKQLTGQKKEAQNWSVGARKVIADETVNDEVILFLAHTAETAVAEVQRAIASCHRAGKALGDLCSKQTWCSDQHWKTTVLLLPASQWEYLWLKNSLHNLLLPTTNVGRSARQISNDVKERFLTFGSAPV